MKVLEVRISLMKKIIDLRAVSVGLALLALAISASASTGPVLQDQCTPENKLAWYSQFRETFKTDQAKANEVASKYLACPAVAGEEQITTYLKNFVTLYAKASRKGQVTDLVFNKKEYVKGIELGKQVLAEEPEYLRTYIDLGYAGYMLALAKNPAYVSDALTYSKKALQMIEGGTAPEDWKPFVNKDEALSWLNNIIASFTISSAPAEAIPYFIKAATIEGPFKKTPQTYANLGQAYEVGVYAKLAEDYKKFAGQDETPESKLAVANINQVVERIVDAHARAVKLAGDDPKNKALKDESLASLKQWYKYLHPEDPETKVNDLVATILTKPLPPQPTPLTSLPASAPAGSPTTGNGAAGAGATATPAAPAATTTTAAKPTPTTPAKPRRHHRRG